jgi:hypothetical protein
MTAFIVRSPCDELRAAAAQRTSNAVAGGEDLCERNSASDGAVVGGFQGMLIGSRGCRPGVTDYSANQSLFGNRHALT